MMLSFEEIKNMVNTENKYLHFQVPNSHRIFEFLLKHEKNSFCENNIIAKFHIIANNNGILILSIF